MAVQACGTNAAAAQPTDAAHAEPHPEPPHRACSVHESHQLQHPQAPQLPTRPRMKPASRQTQPLACAPPETAHQQTQHPQTQVLHLYASSPERSKSQSLRSPDAPRSHTQQPRDELQANGAAALQPSTLPPVITSETRCSPLQPPLLKKREFEAEEVESVYGSAASSPAESKAASRAGSKVASDGELEEGELQVLEEDGTWRAVLEVGADARKGGTQGIAYKCDEGDGEEGVMATNAKQQQNQNQHYCHQQQQRQQQRCQGQQQKRRSQLGQQQQQQQYKREGGSEEEEQQAEKEGERGLLEEGEVLPTPAKTGSSPPSKPNGVTNKTACSTHTGSGTQAGNMGSASVPVPGGSLPGHGCQRAGVQQDKNEREVIVISDSEDDQEADKASGAHVADTSVHLAPAHICCRELMVSEEDLEAEGRCPPSAAQRGPEDDTLRGQRGHDQEWKQQRALAREGSVHKEWQQRHQEEEDDREDFHVISSKGSREGSKGSKDLNAMSMKDVSSKGATQPLKQRLQKQLRQQHLQQEDLADEWDSEEGECVPVVPTTESQRNKKGSKGRVGGKQEKEVEELQLQLQQLKQQRQEQQEQLEWLQQQQASTVLPAASSQQRGGRECKDTCSGSSGGPTAVEESRFLVPDTNVLMHRCVV
ncbi:hypothetical protein DUNSADRAFT_14746 [Dunaliella salina]|uniref:Uncharacterized protein n=1 Tax=Dunaliella salina TaxID=3046 RepID=A0ABQ7G6X4_DUNSA|nr:hypothetical protein DUNSADRAFT_14746 [Dunaliella salina]|eukprot:KAF5830335.1 hypothetical protein DUNSADRAFT_14746 [Dunaliella salina]